MPRMPKWMNDAVESLLASRFLNVTAVAVAYSSLHVKKVRFEAACSHIDFYPGYAVSFRVTALDYRNYTPVMIDDDTFDIVFHLHGKGPGSLFASRMQVGDTFKVIAPRGKKMYRPAAAHFVFGDETSLGLYQAIQQEAQAQHEVFTGLLELDEQNREAAAALGLPLRCIPKENSAAMAAGLDALFEAGAVPPGSMFYLSGNARSMQLCRKLLREHGVQSSQLLMQPYWVEGKRGL